MNALSAKIRMLPPALLAGLLLCARVSAQEEAAVLAKGSGPYFESYLAFQKALGRPVTPYDLSSGKASLPGSVRFAAAFGAKAAALRYPEGAKVICALAPGFNPAGSACATLVLPLPEPGTALDAFQALLPGLKTLAVVRAAGQKSAYHDELAAAARTRGLELAQVAASSPEDLPARLRSLQGRAGAVWLLPEPALITRTSLEVLAAYACSSRIPFFAPSAGLVEFGAAAAVAPGAEETGAAAARAFRAAVAGEILPQYVYPQSEVSYNAAVDGKCGLGLRPPAGARK